MKEEIIKFKTAQAAFEKGFNIYSKDAYFKLEILGTASDIPENTILNDVYQAPTQSFLQKWLREEYNLVVIPWYYHKEVIGGDTYDYRITDINGEYIDYEPDNNFKTYEDALEKGLQEALKLIKKIQKESKK